MPTKRLFETTVTVPVTVEMWTRLECLATVLGQNKSIIGREALRQRMNDLIEKLTPDERENFERLMMSIVEGKKLKLKIAKGQLSGLKKAQMSPTVKAMAKDMLTLEKKEAEDFLTSYEQSGPKEEEQA